MPYKFCRAFLIKSIVAVVIISLGCRLINLHPFDTSKLFFSMSRAMPVPEEWPLFPFM